jgi:hypothetical protein
LVPLEKRVCAPEVVDHPELVFQTLPPACHG